MDTNHKRTVLLIDDDELILSSMGMAFGINGYNVIAASDGEKAIKVFKEKSKEVDYIVLDKSMPRLDGIRTLKQLKNIDKDCVLFMMSGYFSMDEEAKLKEDGVEKIFNKPFSIHDMLLSIEELESA